MAKKIAAKQVEGLVEGLGKAVITSITFTGTTTKTMTITFSDNSTKTATFTDLNDNTTYAAMTATDLTTGTDTTNKVIAAKVMVDYINTRLGSVMTYKGQKNTWAELPTTGNKIGDVWNVVTASDPNGLKAGDNVAWDGTKWDVLSGTIDTSKFLTAEMDPTGVKSIAVTGTTTKTIEVTLNNDSKVSANFTDLNTTYTAGTTADLTTGTGTTAFVWSPKILADWVKSLISGATVNTKTDTFTTAASHLTTGTTAVYTLTATPKTIIGVTMNGVKQPLASYANATTTLTITQSKLPVTIEAGDEIEVTYNY